MPFLGFFLKKRAELCPPTLLVIFNLVKREDIYPPFVLGQKSRHISTLSFFGTKVLKRENIYLPFWPSYNLVKRVDYKGGVQRVDLQFHHFDHVLPSNVLCIEYIPNKYITRTPKIDKKNKCIVLEMSQNSMNHGIKESQLH